LNDIYKLNLMRLTYRNVDVVWLYVQLDWMSARLTARLCIKEEHRKVVLAEGDDEGDDGGSGSWQ